MRTYRSTQRRELDAEREILLPTTAGQLEFRRDQGALVLHIARRPAVHTDLAHALAPLLPPKVGMDPDQSARQYFTEIANQV